MFNNSVTDQKQKVETITKNINKISLELKKMTELSQLLLCDLNLQFGYPVNTEDLKETERNESPFEKSEMPDVSLPPNSFSV
ncbi:putative uncharacterized protein C5orf58 homolog [Octodon degus]|uniref:Uncharacterized protein n=1 Tax=Octodon degus TaxID=10160 RepID=A0A6P6EYY8_OCTDE|nr:putative uncharacterized protein C5orf58 homolog [Octodon degus]